MVRNSKKIGIFLAMLIGMLGLFFFFSWHFGYYALLQPPPSTWIIPYTSSLILSLCGISLTALFLPRSFPYTNLIGFSIFLFSVVRISEILLQIDLGINAMTSSTLHLDPFGLQGISLLAAIGFAISGSILTFWSSKKRTLFQNLIFSSLSILIIFFGMAGLFIGLLSNDSFSSIKETVHIHFYSSVGLLSIGLSFLCANFNTIQPKSCKIKLDPHIKSIENFRKLKDRIF